MRTKTQVAWHLHKQWLYNCYKIYEDYIEFDIEQAENTKSAEPQITSFSKESVESADLHKPVLNKNKCFCLNTVKWLFVEVSF